MSENENVQSTTAPATQAAPPAPPAAQATYLPPPPPPAPVAPAGPAIKPDDFIKSIKDRDDKISKLEAELNTYKTRYADSEKTFASQNETIDAHKKYVANHYETSYNALKDAGIEEVFKFDDFKDNPLEGVNKVNQFKAVYDRAMAIAESKMKQDPTASSVANDVSVTLNDRDAVQARMRELQKNGLKKPG